VLAWNPDEILTQDPAFASNPVSIASLAWAWHIGRLALPIPGSTVVLPGLRWKMNVMFLPAEARVLGIAAGPPDNAPSCHRREFHALA